MSWTSPPFPLLRHLRRRWQHPSHPCHHHHSSPPHHHQNHELPLLAKANEENVLRSTLLPFSADIPTIPQDLSTSPPPTSHHPPSLMGRGHSSSLTGSSFVSRSDADPIEYIDATASADLDWPFGRIDSVDHDDLRETAYELFFTSCRSSPGFGGRNPLTYYPSHENGGGSSNSGDGSGSGSPTAGGGVGVGGRVGGQSSGLVGTSRIKRALGLKTRRSSPKRTAALSQSSTGSSSSGTPNSPGRFRRPLTSAEIMRQQMRVTEQSDHRLRKTLMRTLVGQMGRRAETIILPLELLRQLKPSEFLDNHEYHLWQKRQLKILEAGLLLYPSIPLEQSNASAARLRNIIRSSELKPVDTSKNSEVMRTLCNSVVALAWRTPNTAPPEVCHWADGFPINVHLYISLLQSIFDIREETVVLDEVDELLELLKKTWTTLGINRVIHNVCFTWVLFQQFVVTGQVEQDLLCATLSMMAELAGDAKRADRDPNYAKMLSSTLASMQGWAEKRLLDYHESFEKGAVGGLGLMENVLPLALSAAKIIDEDASGMAGGAGSLGDMSGMMVDASGNRVDYYIRSSLRSAFNRLLEENQRTSSMAVHADGEAGESLIQLARETEELALKEKDKFGPTLKRWHPIAGGVAAVTLHNCYRVVLKQYLAGVMALTHESVRVLQTAGKLEKVLVQMVVEDSVECEDGGKGIVREMIPYEVDSIILGLMKSWIDERLKLGRDCLNRAKDIETWRPKSNAETHAQSAVELMKLAKETVDEFFEIPVGVQEDLVQELADGLEVLLQDYTTFVASCGLKQSYIPALPPLTRCNQDSKFRRLWRKAGPCKAGVEPSSPKGGAADCNHPRPSTSRGTQRLYVRLNTLHYLLLNLHYLDKSLSLYPRTGSGGPSTTTPSPRFPNTRRRLNSSRFDVVRSSLQSAIQHVAEVASYRLIFLDSNHSFYEGLYCNDVANSRIRPALRTLKQNLTLLVTVLTDRAQPLAVKEVMKASFDAFLMVLLAGGSDRAFSKTDFDMVVEDFKMLKRVFATCGEGLVAEEVVEREAEVVEGVVALMDLSTEQLVEDFSIVACEASGLGRVAGGGGKVPMPPTTGRWNRTDPNTILRVLCHRNDEASDRFLKKTFQLAKRR